MLEEKRNFNPTVITQHDIQVWAESLLLSLQDYPQATDITLEVAEQYIARLLDKTCDILELIEQLNRFSECSNAESVYNPLGMFYIACRDKHRGPIQARNS